ncbi:hypothetical protein SCHPADRAFT_819130 [Schizopora paradoxa]|uniref:TFIIB-type domain-containing protein n=1 Tax=Schizopora paradoxa TaxID=27342 RepID=A0A0H2S395_9AGAM|nr:hypothetical protein SCHPADRAFT_819130 [Schizopora paradoxa]
MAANECGECGGKFCWDADAQSAVCLNCGLLEDASQTVLDSQIEPVDNGKLRDSLANTLHPRSTLKSLRSKSGWDLAGQGKAAALDRNKNAMAQFTFSLAKRIGHPGLCPRALLLFEQALERGHVRWGRKARLVAGAALAIALREGRKGETMNDIAFLLEESPVAVARAFTRLVQLLDIKLASTDPSWHLPTLRNRLVEILKEQKPAIPHNLVKLLKKINLPSLLSTAASLSDLVSRAGTVSNLPSPPTACAIFILAIEGELLSSIPNCEQLAKALAVRYGVSGDVVMRRYKVITDEVQSWSLDVPWMRNEAGEPSNKRPKVARRTAVARSLKDVVQYREGIWKAAFEATGPLIAPDEDVEGSVSTASEVELPDNGIDPRRDTQQASSARPKKRRKIHRMDELSEFLLSPLQSQPLSQSSSRSANMPSLDAVSHILAADSPSFEQPATRLQVLSLSKSPDDITDEELFGEGELESLMRTQEERDVLAHALGWSQEGNQSGRTEEDEAHTANARARDQQHGGTSRINIEALNRLLDDAEVLGDAEAWYDNEDDWTADFAGVDLLSRSPTSEICENFGHNRDHPFGAASSLGHEAGDDVLDDEALHEPWMPLSPGRGTDWEEDARF